MQKCEANDDMYTGRKGAMLPIKIGQGEGDSEQSWELLEKRERLFAVI